uniref:Uncharacterized protein n=1 Tax=Sphaerodactylus townsendi TaxID=933632 RepID=A0ACB8EQM6_9SAUR
MTQGLAEELLGQGHSPAGPLDQKPSPTPLQPRRTTRLLRQTPGPEESPSPHPLQPRDRPRSCWGRATAQLDPWTPGPEESPSPHPLQPRDRPGSCWGQGHGPAGRPWPNAYYCTRSYSTYSGSAKLEDFIP